LRKGRREEESSGEESDEGSMQDSDVHWGIGEWNLSYDGITRKRCFVTSKKHMLAPPCVRARAGWSGPLIRSIPGGSGSRRLPGRGRDRRSSPGNRARDRCRGGGSRHVPSAGERAGNG